MRRNTGIALISGFGTITRKKRANEQSSLSLGPIKRCASRIPRYRTLQPGANNMKATLQCHGIKSVIYSLNLLGEKCRIWCFPLRNRFLVSWEWEDKPGANQYENTNGQFGNESEKREILAGNERGSAPLREDELR